MGVEGVEVVCELVGAVTEAGHADYGVLGDHTLLVEGVAASEVGGFFLANKRETAGPAVGRSLEAVQFLVKVVD